MGVLKKFLPILLVAVIAAGTLVAKATGATTEIGYRKLLKLPAERSIATVDTSNVTAPLNPVLVNDDQFVTARVEGSVAAGTVTLVCQLWFQNADGSYTYLGEDLKQLTLGTTAEPDTVNGGLFVATSMPAFDTRGATHYDLRVEAISGGGTAKIRPWSYGAASH